MAEDGSPEVDEGSEAASENDFEDTGKDEDALAMAEQIFDTDDGENEKIASEKRKYDPKDPLRPRRKKARRACYACQRAHLTCGDERPCQRCIKRGLADACQDGVRKKAKYLHDAPPEALRPVLGPAYNVTMKSNNRNSGQTAHLSGPETSPNVGTFFPSSNMSPPYPMFQNRSSQMQPSPQDSTISFGTQQSPLSSSFQTPTTHRQNSIQSMDGSLLQQPQSIQTQTAFNSTLFDPNNPDMFNFDMEGLSFGNQYGAMEFGMLGHMSSGAAQTPTHDPGVNGDVSFNGSGFGNDVGSYGQLYSQQDAVLPDLGNGSNTIFGNEMQRTHPLPLAYSIANGVTNMNSPSTDNNSPQPSLPFESSPTTVSYPGQSNGDSSSSTGQSGAHRRPLKRAPPPPESKSGGGGSNSGNRGAAPHHGGGSGLLTAGGSRSGRQGRQDPSCIYDSVREPYAYTSGFHRLIAFIQRRFSAGKTLRIAKSLASIRPSFISCTKTLKRQDLVFMEQYFQRTLFEYEDFMVHCCTPTIVCRRTGEVAAVNNEFTLLTGWRREVLLGKEPNLNVNTGRQSSASATAAASASASASGPGGGAGRAGPAKATEKTAATAAAAAAAASDGRSQPVFLAELLDDDSVIEFYEDFGRLAFVDPRGSVTTKCKLLKYQTKEDLDSAEAGPAAVAADAAGGRASEDNKRKTSHNSGSADRAALKRKDAAGGSSSSSLLGGRVTKIDGEHGIGRLERDGKLECVYCWIVKRDVFDIPMLIVMNVSVEHLRDLACWSL